MAIPEAEAIAVFMSACKNLVCMPDIPIQFLGLPSGDLEEMQDEVIRVLLTDRRQRATPPSEERVCTGVAAAVRAARAGDREETLRELRSAATAAGFV